MTFNDYLIDEVETYFNRDKNHLVQYYRVLKNHCPCNFKNNSCTSVERKGMFIAIPTMDENTIGISWSSCNPKDVFKSYFGWFEAYRKLQSIEPVPPPKDIKIKKAYELFIDRCKRYYKDKILIIV
jgi:hypothetical protein